MAKKKAAEKKDAGECPVMDAPCEKSCAPDQCQAEVRSDISPSLDHELGKVKSSSVQSDLDKHPKFDKFKTGGQPK